MPFAQLYITGCDVCLDPAVADNVRANLVAVAGSTYLLAAGDVRSLGPAPVAEGHGCLALYAPWDPERWPEVRAAVARGVAAGLSPGQALARVTAAAGGSPGLWDGAPADWWLVPGGPLWDVQALGHPRWTVRAGCLFPPPGC